MAERKEITHLEFLREQIEYLKDDIAKHHEAINDDMIAISQLKDKISEELEKQKKSE